MNIWSDIKTDYTQTCSKTEQLTLALFMADGSYSTNIKKLRKLYSQKLQVALSAFNVYADGIVQPVNTQSGINILLKVRTKKDPIHLSELARSLGLNVIPTAELTDQDTSALIFYYNQIPLEAMDAAIENMINKWTE